MVIVYFPNPKNLWYLIARGRNVIARGQTPRTSHRGAGDLDEIQLRGPEVPRGTARYREVPGVKLMAPDQILICLILFDLFYNIMIR